MAQRQEAPCPGVVPWVCTTISDDLDDWKPFYRDPAVARLLLTASRRLLEAPAQANRRHFRQCFLAVNAWLCGEYTLAVRTLETMGRRLHSNSAGKVWRYYGDEIPTFLSEVAILASPERGNFEEAQKAFEARNWESARRGYEKVRVALGEKAEPLTRRRLAALEFEERFDSGEWVKAPVTEDLAAWQAGGGEWSATRDGALLCKGDGRGAALAFCARVGDACEVRAEVSFEGAADRDASFAIGFGVHHACKRSNFPSAHIYRGKEAPKEISAAGGNHFGVIEGAPVRKFPVAPEYRLHVSWRDGKLRYELDGNVIAEDFVLPKPPQAGFGERFALGAMDLDIGVVMRVRNIEVRRLGKGIQK